MRPASQPMEVNAEVSGSVGVGQDRLRPVRLLYAAAIPARAVELELTRGSGG